MKELSDEAPWAHDVRRAAAILYGAGARAVWLFGSRAGDRTTDRLSDFDLAVEGLADRTGAIAQASRELRGKVDVICVESATPALRWGIAHSRILIPRVELADTVARSRPPLPESLAGMRTRAAAELIREIGARSVIDFGCGHGWLLTELAADVRIERLTGVDFSPSAIMAARRRIARASWPGGTGIIDLREGILTYRDRIFLGHDAAVALEVIEHLDAPQLAAFVGVMFDHVRPARAILTTPNAEYNVVWLTRRPNGRRHPDHRFEWSRAEFAKWAGGIAAAHRYQVRISTVGRVHTTWGPPTQLAVFDRLDLNR